MSSWALNFSFMSMFFLCVVLRQEYFARELILTIGSWAMFLMWIKVFYWCRLFSSYAYYVRLIMQTISDSRKFMILVMIILISFGNFIYVADATNYGTSITYAGTYFGVKPLDAVISVYDFGALGDINTPLYTRGFETISMMFMFLFATFMVSVVFMNMLIAIMSNTFSVVLRDAVSNGLREQVLLMEDHVWLVDTEAIFNGQKYIMKVAPSTSGPEFDDKVEERVNEVGDFMSKQVSDQSIKLMQRINIVETNTRFMLDYQHKAIDHMITKIKGVNEVIFDIKEEQTMTAESKIKR